MNGENETETKALATQTDIELILTRAVEMQVPIETMERLLALRKELKAEAARDAFFEAMAQFQSIKPSVPKRYQVLNRDNTVRYKYAKMDDIAAAINEPLGKCGLSYKFEMTFSHEGNNHYEVAACVVTHIAGHSERTEFKVPVEFSGGMNAIQAFGSASTYAKRYALCNAFGISPDEDDDASSVKRPYVETQQASSPPRSKSQQNTSGGNGWSGDYDGKLTGFVVNFRAASGKSPAKMNVQGEAVSTFDKNLAEVAETCAKRNVQIAAYWKESQGYKNVVHIEAIKEQPAEPQPEGTPLF